MSNPPSFATFQALCISVAKEMDINSVKNLKAFLIKQESNFYADGIKQYIAFPLVMLLKSKSYSNKKNDALLQEILACFNILFQNSDSLDFNFFQDIFLRIFICLSETDNPQKVACLSEECMAASMEITSLICSSLTADSIPQYCGASFMPALGHAIFICLQLSEREKSRQIKIKAMQALKCLGLCHIMPQLDSNSSPSYELRKSLANFLPGISITCFKIASGDETQGHAVTIAAMNCLQYFVTFVMADVFLVSLVPSLGVSDSAYSLQQKLFGYDSGQEACGSKSDVASPDEETQSKSESHMKLRNVVIDRQWLTATSDRLVRLFSNLNPLLAHSHWKVRLSLINCCEAILQHCPISLFGCAVTIVEILVALSNDIIIDVADEAQSVIETFKSNLTNDDKIRLIEMLEERVFVLTSKLPTIVRSQSDAKIVCSVQQLFGCLDMMGMSISHLLQMPNHHQRLLRAILVVFTLDCSDPDLLSERLFHNDDNDLLSVKPNLGQSFRFFQSHSVLKTLSDICSLIGSSDQLTLVVDLCLELLMESSLYQKECLILLQLIIKGTSNGSISVKEKENVVSTILDTILSMKLLESRTRLEEPQENTGILNASQKEVFSVDAARKNVVLIVMVLRLIGVCATMVGKSFTMFFSSILCHVLEKAGSTNAVICHTASVTLETIATACDYEEVSELVEMSVPYFWFSLSQKLKRLPDYPSAPLVLRFALKCNRGKVKVYIEDLVDDIMEALDEFNATSSLSLLKVLSIYVEFLAKDSDTEEPVANMPFEASERAETSDTLCDFLRKIDRQHEIIQEEMRDSSQSEEIITAESFTPNLTDKEAVEEEKETEEAPRHIKLISNILEKCSFLLFVKDRHIQITILQIIRDSISVLRNWENQRLPAFHKLWKPLVLRIKDKDFAVILKALELCTLMIESSSDFLRRRFFKELFPSLLNLLKSQCHSSLNKTEKSGYFISPEFKVQFHILQNLPSLVRSLDFGVVESIQIFETILLYCDQNQPKQLIQLALKSFKVLAEVLPDLTWEVLAHCGESCRILPPSSRLKPVIIRSHNFGIMPKELELLYAELS